MYRIPIIPYRVNQSNFDAENFSITFFVRQVSIKIALLHLN